jgi:hypothetical protein
MGGHCFLGRLVGLQTWLGNCDAEENASAQLNLDGVRHSDGGQFRRYSAARFAAALALSGSATNRASHARSRPGRNALFRRRTYRPAASGQEADEVGPGEANADALVDIRAGLEGLHRGSAYQ